MWCSLLEQYSLSRLKCLKLRVNGIIALYYSVYISSRSRQAGDLLLQAFCLGIEALPSLRDGPGRVHDLC